LGIPEHSIDHLVASTFACSVLNHVTESIVAGPPSILIFRRGECILPN
jgi:hypothetical protein